jgi:hypothetical protein
MTSAYRIRLASTFRRSTPMAFRAFEATRWLIDGYAYRLLQWDDISVATDAGIVFG